MSDSPKVVPMKKAEKNTRVTLWLPKLSVEVANRNTHVVTHFCFEDGILTFEDDLGQKFATNLPFLIEEDFKK